MNKKLKTGLGYAAWIGDYVIAALGGIFVAGRNVRNDIMAPENIDKPIPFFKTYKKHLVEHVKKHNSDKLSARAFTRYMQDKDTYNPYAEINDKNLGDIVQEMKDAYHIFVTYFEETEHQPRAPQSCRFGDYVINFAPYGTKWCGGMRGNGFVSMLMPNGTTKPVATISTNLSDYLANMVAQKAK